MEFYIILAYVLAFIGLYATVFYILSVLNYVRESKGIVKRANDKTVSIIIPAYNEGATIARTIESALSLEYPKEKLEIIVIDDGSKDDTYKIAKKYQSNKNPRVIVLTKPNGGKGSALNLGIKNSKSEIIVTMDADTFVETDALEKMIAYFDKDRVVSVTPSMGVHNARNFWERLQQIEYYVGVFLRKAFATVNAIHITPGAFSAYRREFFVKHGGYDEGNITEDLEIALRIQSNNYIIENAETAAIYTVAPRKFRPLLFQRRRWYVGLIKNMWNYRKLFGPKNGVLGILILPVAVITVVLSMVLTTYSVVRTVLAIKSELVSLSSINFQFGGAFALNKYIFINFFYDLFSNQLFLISLLFMVILLFYMLFSKKSLRYRESVAINFVLFLIFYTFFFAFWWIISFLYVIFNRKVLWRENHAG